MKHIAFLAFICMLSQPTASGMQKKIKDPKIEKIITKNLSKPTFASIKTPLIKNYPKITEKISYRDAINTPQKNQNFWKKITSKIKLWFNTTPKFVSSKALTPGSFADLKIKEAAVGNNAIYPKIKQRNMSTSIGRRWYSTYKNEDKKFHSKYNDFTENDFIKEFSNSNDPEKLYRDLLKIYHPDLKRFSAEFCDERTKAINNAFENFKEFKGSNETIKKETTESKKTKTHAEGPIEDVKVKSDIMQEWIKEKAINDKYRFNQENDLSYRDYFSEKNSFFYYQIHFNFDDGSIKTARDLSYVNEAFIPTNAPVPEKYQTTMHKNWLNKQMRNDEYYFNNKYKLKGRLRHTIGNKYYELNLRRDDGKVTAVIALRYKEGEFVPTQEAITQETYRSLIADGFSFEGDNTNIPQPSLGVEELKKLMLNDAYDFNKKNNNKYRTIEYSGNNGLPKYYEFIINLSNGTYAKVIDLIYKNGSFIENENAQLPAKEELDDLFYNWLERKMYNDKYKFNQSNKDQFRFIIQKINAFDKLADLFGDNRGGQKRTYPEHGYYQAFIDLNGGTITKIIKLTFSNDALTLTDKISSDERIYKKAHSQWMDFIIEEDRIFFNRNHQNKKRILYTSEPIQYCEAEFDVKNGTVIEAYWLDYKNGKFVKSVRKIGQEELKKIYAIGSSNK